ncbi:MAG: hypothetical protein AB1439_01685 [candidate division FCPU426 bacterium]
MAGFLTFLDAFFLTGFLARLMLFLTGFFAALAEAFRFGLALDFLAFFFAVGMVRLHPRLKDFGKKKLICLIALSGWKGNRKVKA